MLTSRKRLPMHVSATEEACNRAALLLILELDQWDIQQGNYLDSEAFFEELDREQSEERARTDGER